MTEPKQDAKKEKTGEKHQFIFSWNPNSYPLDPRTNKNHLSHVPPFGYSPKLFPIASFDEFFKEWEFEDQIAGKVMKARQIGYKGPEGLLVKIYDKKKLKECVKEYIIVTELALNEYGDIYHNHDTEQIYIMMTPYDNGHTLRHITDENKADIGNIFENNEQEIKIMASDILDKIWILHNSGYINGDIKRKIL